MRILHIITGLNTGGAERMLVKLINHTYTDVEHHVISLLDEGTQGEIIKNLGVPLYTVNMKMKLPPISSIFKLKRLITSIRPDLIQGWMYHGNLAASVNGFSTPIVYNIRHSLSDIKQEKMRTQWIIKINKKFSNKTSKVIYNSNKSCKEHEEFGFDQSKSVFLPNGFDTDEFNIDIKSRRDFRSKYNIPSTSRVFCQIGRNHQMKNHMGYLEAANKILNQHKNLHFILVGRGVDSDDDLNKMTSKNKDQFTLLDEQTNIANVWNASDIGVLSSLWGEGFPNVIGEAMACGKPCVVTDVGDSAFIVDDCGLISNPNDFQSLVGNMNKMLNLSNIELKQLGLKARSRIVENFSIDKIGKDYLDLYESIVNKR